MKEPPTSMLWTNDVPVEIGERERPKSSPSAIIREDFSLPMFAFPASYDERVDFIAPSE